MIDKEMLLQTWNQLTLNQLYATRTTLIDKIDAIGNSSPTVKQNLQEILDFLESVIDEKLTKK